MIRFGEAESPNVKLLRVGTQLANTGSLRLYEGLGFRQCQAQYVFHYHSPRTA